MNGFPGKVPLKTVKGRSTRLWWSPLGIWGGVAGTIKQADKSA